MLKFLKPVVEYLKHAVWLIPVTLSAILCMYFMNLFQRIDEAQLRRQIDERDNIIEITKFIKTKDTLYAYLDIIDRFEDNNLYLLDNKLELLPDKRHTRHCYYSMYSVTPPFEIEKFRQEMLKNKVGTFDHKIVPGIKLNFQYRHIRADNKEYILLAGVHNYVKLPEEEELYFAIGLLLLFTAVCNLIIVIYAKHMRYLCHLENDKK